MRKLILSLVFIVAASVAADAQPRQTLLAPDGTLFAIDSVATTEAGAASNHFVLRTQRNGEVTSDAVPATLDNSQNANPAIAYDPATGSVFVFWLRHLGTMSSQLMFACRDAAGVWSAAEEFGNPFVFRENLRIAVTRRVSDTEGAILPDAAISVHLAWWEFNTHTGTESAQYAMLNIENGAVAGRETLQLAEFASGSAATNVADANVLRQPLLFTAPTQDTILLVFGDVEKQSVHQVRIRPTLPPVQAEGRLRVPVGRHERSSGAPGRVVSNGRVEGLYGNSERLGIYGIDGGEFRYAVLSEGKWSDTRSIKLDEQVTASTAVEALRRLLNEQ